MFSSWSFSFNYCWYLISFPTLELNDFMCIEEHNSPFNIFLKSNNFLTNIILWSFLASNYSMYYSWGKSSLNFFGYSKFRAIPNLIAMYMKDFVKDWGSTHLETCNWYFIYSSNCLPMLEKTLREKYDVGFMDKLASSEWTKEWISKRWGRRRIMF